MTHKEKIAIDVGGVLIEKKVKYGPDTNFDPNDIKWIPGALNAVRELSALYDVYILSFCGKRTEWETRQTLRREVARYVPETKWIFTREREHKVDQMNQRGITTLIDDTPEIISWVDEAGLCSIHFLSDTFPDWPTVVEHLRKRSDDGRRIDDGANESQPHMIFGKKN